MNKAVQSNEPHKVQREQIRTYEAGSGVGPAEALMLAFRDLYWSRHVLWHLFKRDFVAGFRQKLLGYLWIVLAPLVGIASFVFMEEAGVLKPGNISIPYPIYVFIGTSIWGTFISALSVVANGLIANTDLVIRTNIPRIGLAVTGLASLLYNTLVNLIVLLLLLLLFRFEPSPWAALYPLALLPVMILGIGLGLILSVVGAVARDITGMFITLVNLLMYVTPVVYTAQFTAPLLKAIVRWNPLTYLVDMPRNLFVAGHGAQLTGFLLATLFSCICFSLGVHSFYLIKDKVAERL